MYIYVSTYTTYTFYVKYCSLLTQYFKIDLFKKIFFSKKYIYVFLDPILCNLMRPKTWVRCLSISIMSNVHCIQVHPIAVYLQAINL